MSKSRCAIEVLRRLVAFDTTSNNSNLDLIEWVVDSLEGHGARIRLTSSASGEKANLLATFGPDAPGGILLSAHTDVVPVDGQHWSTDPFNATECDGKLYGRGTSDMKAFIASCLAATPEWAGARLERPIHLALTHDEETGCLGVPSLIDDMVNHVPLPAVAFVGEPTGMRVSDQHRGYLGFRTEFHGRAAHSSDPDRGASAIAAAAKFVDFLSVPELQRADGVTRTTCNVGQIEGGASRNAVAERCEVHWEMRPSVHADVDRLRRDVKGFAEGLSLPGIVVETREVITVPPLRPGQTDPAVRLARAFGLEPAPGSLPYGTEAGFFQAAGIPTAICGPGSIEQAHQPDEWIELTQLDDASHFLDHVTRWAERADD